MRQASSTCIEFLNHADVHSMSVIFCCLLRICIAVGSPESHDPNQALSNNPAPNTCSSSSKVSTDLEAKKDHLQAPTKLRQANLRLHSRRPMAVSFPDSSATDSMSNNLANLEYPALFMFGTFGNDESSSNVCRAIIVIHERWPPLRARMVEVPLLVKV
jgi:hypothetical protein